MEKLFSLTLHVRQRYCTRVFQLKEKKVENFLAQPVNFRKIDAYIYRDLNQAVENRKPFEISNICDHLIQKYGPHITFLMTDKTIYVVSKETKPYVVLTCYDKKGYIGYFS